jgi:hypothetical protein
MTPPARRLAWNRLPLALAMLALSAWHAPMLRAAEGTALERTGAATAAEAEGGADRLDFSSLDGAAILCLDAESLVSHGADGMAATAFGRVYQHPQPSEDGYMAAGLGDAGALAELPSCPTVGAAGWVGAAEWGGDRAWWPFAPDQAPAPPGIGPDEPVGITVGANFGTPWTMPGSTPTNAPSATPWTTPWGTDPSDPAVGGGSTGRPFIALWPGPPPGPADAPGDGPDGAPPEEDILLVGGPDPAPLIPRVIAEPATLLLLGGALIVLGLLRRERA